MVVAKKPSLFQVGHLRYSHCNHFLCQSYNANLCLIHCTVVLLRLLDLSVLDSFVLLLLPKSVVLLFFFTFTGDSDSAGGCKN